MIDSVIGSLEANESIISAVVGLLTLAASAWSVAILVLPQRRRAVQTIRGFSPAKQESISAVLWNSILDRGLDSRSEMETRISVRTVNIALLCLGGVSLAWLLASLASRSTIVLTVLNFVVFLIAVLAFLLQSGKAKNVSRWLFLLDVAFYWLANLVIIGPMLGLEYFLGALLILPLLIFTRHEQRQQYGAIAGMVLTLLLAMGLQNRINFNLSMSETFVSLGYYSNAAFLAILVFLVLNFYNNSAANRLHELEDQKAKADELVRSILPDYVAERVAQHQSTIADWHQEATVLFATVYGFELLYRRVSAVQLVELLSQIFVEFDRLVTRLGIEKVKTLGTNYVAATGIDQSDEAEHEQLAAVALGMRDVVRRVSASVNHSFILRVGISTGQVVSGVIGETRPCFDIWGETVELANSMRGSAVENSIVVNEAAYWRLRDAFEFVETDAEEPRYLLMRAKNPAGGRPKS